ncbi:GRAM and VASt domain-containing protein [Sporobolomyces salmoneus]|uniref:GRAM and VASt domain-containing protein n=1 Tax=Sporobolomyces salmoneus TaxID=183962 RepID=UPI0031704CD9
MTSSASGSEGGEPVLVSHPSSPIRMSPPSLSSTTSRQPEPQVIADTDSRHVTALSPKAPENTTTGIGATGRAQLDRLTTSSVLGGTEAVVGPAHGEAPEYVATLRKQTSIGGVSATEEGGGGENDDHETSKGPKWFKKVKDGVSSIKEKAASSSASMRDRSDSASVHSSSGGFTRDRTHTNDSRLSAAVPDRIITDEHGNPVPVHVGGAETPPSGSLNQAQAVKRDDFAQPGVGSLADSTTTSVKEKVLENFAVEPRTSQEKFHSMFKDISNREELIEDYRCALVRDIPVQGKLYLSEHYLSFHAAILGWETNLTIPWSEIVSIEKRMTAKVIPNAIEVTTLHASHTFSSFLARDAAFKLIAEIWQHVHPGENLAPDGDATSTPYAAEPDVDVKSQISFEDEKGEKKSHKFKTGIAAIKNHIRSASIDTRKTSSSPTEAEKVKRQAQAGGGGSGGHAATVYDGPEYKNEALDCILPTSPDKAYELFFANEEFLKKFLEEKENLKEVDIGPWKAVDGDAAAKDDDHALKERDMSYLKPLNAPVGPKQTHCIIHDKNDQMDPETCISNLTTTKTPDVPSGDNFSTVTRSTFTWAEGGGTHVRVTTEVEWTKVNRMLRGVIERGAIDGQKTYHKDLEEAVRAHIEANKDEYGVETSGEPPAPKPTATSSSSSADSGSFLDMLPVSPTALLLVLVVLLTITNFFTLLSLRHQAAAARSVRIGHPAEVANAVSRVLGDFNSLHQQRAAGPSGQGVAGEVEHLKKVLAGLESHISNIAGQVSKAVGQVKEASDRMEGVRAML